MSICRINFAALIAAAVAVVAAHAQDDAQDDAQGDGAPVRPASTGNPLDRFGPAVGNDPFNPTPPDDPEVIASELEEVDPFVVGVLRPADGGLPTTLWSGSDLASIADAASRVSGETGFLAASQMAGRALLSGGPAPQGPGDRRVAQRERLAALLDLGRVDDVDSIVTQTPRGLNDPEFAAMAVRARLAKNDIVSACQVGDALTDGRDGAFWLRLRTACYAWAEESAAAQITLDLAREADAEVADEDFTTWVFAAASRTAPRNPPLPRDALESALAQSAGFEFDAESLERLPLLVAVGLMHDDDLAPEVRALAALRAARTGAASADELAAVLDEVPVPAEATTPADLIAASRAEVFPAADAMLRDAAAADGAGPFEVAEAIELALARAETPADFILTARAYAEPLKALPVSEDLLLVAPQFAMAAAAIGDRQLAYAWLDPRATGLAASADGFLPIFNAAPDFSRSPVDPEQRIDAETIVAAGDPGATPRRLSAVAMARLAAAGDDDVKQVLARRDALLLLALGAEVTPELRRAAAMAVEESHLVSDAAAQALSLARFAAQSRALGETALYLSQAAGEAGPAHAPTIAAAIEIARVAGLNEDARALAVESMLASRVGPIEFSLMFEATE